MHHISFLQDLAVVMIVAAIVTVLFRQLKQPVVLGYILAGVIIGPHTPPAVLISDPKTIETLSELGIIFLMFSLGLEFSLRKLREVGVTAVIAATFEILLMVWAGYELGRGFGWSEMDSVFLGAILSISSTTIILKALQELGKTKETFASLIFGILIVEDILAVVMIALLSGFASSGTFNAGEMGQTLLKISAFLGAVLVVGLIAVPRLLNYVAKFRSDEMLLVTVVGLCFGVSLLAVKMEYSVALGAFLIGAIIAEARQIAKIEALTHPVRDLFSAVFFVSIGLLINPALLLKYAVPILVISAVVVVGKVISCSFGTFIAGNDKNSSLRVGMGLAQIGEFSFIIAALGLQKGVTSDFLYPIAVAVSAVTTMLTPYLIRSADWLVARFEQGAPRGLVQSMDTYTQWVGNLGKGGTPNLAGQLMRKWGWQIGLNLLLVLAVYLATVAARGKAFAFWPTAPGGMEGVKAGLWIAATILSLPMLIAVFRKLQALAMLVAEVHVKREVAGEATQGVRQVVTGIIVVAGSGLLLLFVLVLSSAILPSRNALLAALLLLVAAAILLWRSSIRIHARAQGALRDTFAQPPVDRHLEQRPMPALFREAEVHSLLIGEQSPAAGKLIGELRLRTRSGASIVGIEREQGNIINPGPDEELRPGDHALVLGSLEQIAAARTLISETEAMQPA